MRSAHPARRLRAALAAAQPDSWPLEFVRYCTAVVAGLKQALGSKVANSGGIAVKLDPPMKPVVGTA
jgi:hypothetical protein